MTSAQLCAVQAKDPTLQEILVALSFALDLTEGAMPGHAIRSCLLAVRVAHAAGTEMKDISDLYYSSLLKDVGCSSNSARMCQIVGGDDRVVKAGAKLADWTRPLRPNIATLKLLWREVLPDSTFVHRGGRLAKLAMTQHENNRQLIEMRCDRGAMIVHHLGLGSEVALAVRHLDEHWDGGGYPKSLKGQEIPLLSRLMAVAQHLDVFCMNQGPQAAIDTLIERAGRWFDPELAKAARSLHKTHQLFNHCLPNDPVTETRAAILALQPEGRTELSAMDVESICETFADVVDAKSPFTYRHSLGVMEVAIAIGGVLGLPADRMQLLRRAALLHDIGKLGISNTILDKPSQLTDEEREIVKAHPAMSASILGHIAAFGEVAILAGEHHEKLDGSGYPNGLCLKDLSLESRLLAVADFYGALSEDRPYRRGLAPLQIRAIMDLEVPAHLDGACYEALCTLMDSAGWASRQSERLIDNRWALSEFDPIEAFI